jgi:UDPglucose 6-dehydrogenase
VVTVGRVGLNKPKIFSIQYASSAISCLINADRCILLTKWDEFKKLTPEDNASSMRQPVLVHGRRIYDPEIFREEFVFRAIVLGGEL